MSSKELSIEAELELLQRKSFSYFVHETNPCRPLEIRAQIAQSRLRNFPSKPIENARSSHNAYENCPIRPVSAAPADCGLAMAISICPFDRVQSDFSVD